MSEIINRDAPEVSRYYTKCFHCGAGFIYKKTEVHHNAALNRVVGRHGFTGYDGEIHCPGCGTWLPHYEQNLYREAPKQAAPAEQPAADGARTAEKPKYCGQCGSPVAPDVSFCGQCGAKIQ